MDQNNLKAPVPGDSPRSRLLAATAIPAAALVYLGLFLLMAWPLPVVFSSHYIGGSEDGAMSLWSLWWMKYSLVDLGQSPLYTQYLFYPEGASLVFHSMPKLLGIISIPFQVLFSLAATYNIIVALTFVGTGLTTYWLTYHLIREHLPAILAGVLFMLAPYRWGQLAHLTLLSTLLIPVFLLLVLKGYEAIQAGKRRRWIYFGLAGGAMGASAYDTEYYPVFMALFSVILFGYCLYLARRMKEPSVWKPLLKGMLLAFGVAVVIYAPLLAAAAGEVMEKGDYAGSSSGMAQTYATDLPQVFLPGWQSYYLGSIFGDTRLGTSAAETAYLGWSALILAAIGVMAFRRSRAVWLWVVVALIFLLLAFGPRPLDPYSFLPGIIRKIPGPFLVFSQTPFLDSIRVPSRFICMSALAIAVLAGFGIRAILERLRRHRLSFLTIPAVTVAVLVVTFGEFRPMVPVISASVPPAFEAIGRSETPGPVLVIPLGWETGVVRYGDEQSWTQIPQTVHHRPMLGGMVARAPAEQLAREADAPVLRYLSDPGKRVPGEADKDPAAIARFFADYQVAFIVCEKRMPEAFFGGTAYAPKEIFLPETLAAIDEYVQVHLRMKKIEETDEVVVYQR